MWANQLETLFHSGAHNLPLMPFGTRKVVPITGQTHPETPWCVNTESNMVVGQWDSE